MIRFALFFACVMAFGAPKGAPQHTPVAKAEETPGYTINFNNVPIIEFMRFVGKIGKVNFVYNEEELAFNVTVVSEEPASLTNVMAALVQVLQINGFHLVEDGPNLLVHKEGGGGGLATVVSPELPYEGDKPPPIVTRVFKIENGNVSNIAQILRPLMSEASILEASAASRHLIVTDTVANVDRVAELLLSLDSAETPLEMDVYAAKNTSIDSIVTLATQILTPLSGGETPILVPQPATQSIYIIGTPHMVQKALAVLEDLDTLPSEEAQGLSGKNVLLYKLQGQNPELLQDALRQIAQELSAAGGKDQPLVNAIESMRYIPTTSALFFRGPPEVLSQLSDILTNITAEGTTSGNNHFFIYKIRVATEEQIAKSLNNLAENLEDSGAPDEGLIGAIDSMRWVKETHSLIFSGSPNALAKLKEILPTFDVPPGEAQVGLSQYRMSSDFFLYTPKNHSGTELIEAIEHIASNLQASGLADPGLIATLKSAKWTPSTDSILFTGDKESLDKVRDLMQTVDVIEAQGPGKNRLFIYKPEFVSAAYMRRALDSLADKLPSGDPLRRTIENAELSEEADSLVFNGPSKTITYLKQILPTLDNAKQAEIAKASGKGYAVIKLQSISGDAVIRDLDRMAKNMRASGMNNSDVLEAIDNIEWVKQTNSLYVSGTPQAIAKVRELIAQFDVEDGTTPGTSKVVVYKTINVNAERLVELLHEMGENLRGSGFSDPEVVQSIESVRAVSKNSVVITGSPNSITQVRELLRALDLGNPENESLGKVSFIAYKLNGISGRALIAYLNGIAADLEKAGNTDPTLVDAIRSARYVAETKSVIFTGPERVLQSIETLANIYSDQQEGGEAPGRTGFVVYNPKYAPGPELVQVMKDFAMNLTQSGVDDQELIETIDSLKWMPKTRSILISGSDASVKKTESLLNRFDMSDMTAQDAAGLIDSDDDMSFLIYKLQYHQGAEIESALQKVAVDLSRSKSESTKLLVDAIQSVQWIEVTNSLISTGPPQTLERLRELMRSIDVPLKQVFIEVLVLDTDLSNNLELGLRWMSQGKYRSKLGWAGGVTPSYQGGSSGDPFSNFNKELSATNATTTPTGTNLPIGSGFSLGVIGDIIFHKGQSYAALGSLVDALRTDGDVTIVLNQKLITQDGKQSTLFLGDNIPFNGSTVLNTQSSGGTVQTANIEYRDIGISLTITPRVGDNGMVSLSIDQEITQRANQGDSSSSQDITLTINGIETTKTQTQTQVTMPNNHFLVLSGSITDTTARDRQSIPCLGGLPLIGAAFTRNEVLTQKKNVIIFVKPQIIENFDVYDQITERQEELHRSQAPSEEFDAGLDLVKTPDNESLPPIYH